jgi:hypothetical protein
MLAMFVLFITSLALVVFVPTNKQRLNEASIAKLEHVLQGADTKQQSGYISQSEDNVATIMVVLAKGSIAIILGLFALFCVCSRLGYCLTKRNKAILASTYNPRTSTDI